MLQYLRDNSVHLAKHLPTILSRDIRRIDGSSHFSRANAPSVLGHHIVLRAPSLTASDGRQAGQSGHKRRSCKTIASILAYVHSRPLTLGAGIALLGAGLHWDFCPCLFGSKAAATRWNEAGSLRLIVRGGKGKPKRGNEVASSRGGEALAGISVTGVSRLRRIRTGLAGLTIGAFLVAAPAATAFFQTPNDPSPESGTAQVVAQGVVDIGAEDLRWQVVERVAPPPANASQVAADLGFLTVDSGVMLVDDLASGEQFRLPAGETALTRAGSEQTRAALGSENASYREIGLVNATAEAPADGTVLFTSEPFAGLGARHDLDLLSDLLAPGAQLAIPAGSLPTLVLILDGTADVTTEAGDIISLGTGEATSLAGAMTLTASEIGASILAARTGPAVPRLTPAAGTPRAGRVVETAQTSNAAPEASPAAADEDANDNDSDEDGDGISANREAREGTDPALADTDEDGLTDGQEVREFNTNPLAADTDGDGVLDGDEVAQGTNPVDSAAAAQPVVEEAAPAVEEPAAAVEETTPVEEAVSAEEIAPEPAPATPGDSDGDGLEDAIEYELGTDPFDTDTDDDGLTDGDEYYVFQTGTRNPDTDGDGVVDGDEAARGTNPNDPNS